MATYDGACHYKKFCTQMTQGKAVRFHLEHFLPAEARRKIEIPYDIVLGTFTGEWHDAADLYKKWAVKQRWCAKKLAERDDVPKILKEGAALFAVPFYHEIMIYNLYDFNVVPRLPAIAAAFQKATGMAHVGIIPIGWENRGAWAGINYFPAKPSEEAWQTVSRELKKDGNFLMMMPGGFNWIVRRRADGRMGPGFDDTEQFEREKDMLIAKKDGQPSRAECYDIPHCYIGTRVRLCRGSQKARETVAGIFHHLAEMGCSLIQFDQEDGGAQAEPCYRKGHGHRIGYTNEYTEKFLEMCENVIRENRKIDPDFGVTMENLGEAVIPVSAAMWGRQCSEIDEALHHTRSTALFSYLYHEYQICLGDGFSMGQGLSAVQGSAELRAFRLANSVVRGLLPTVYMEQVELDADDAWTQKVSKAFCAFCRPVSRFTEYLVLGTTRRAPQLQCADQKVWHYVLDPGERLPDGRETYGNVRTALYRKWVKRPAVVAGSFEAADGSLGTILINATDLEQRVSFRLSGGWQSIEMYDGGRAPLPAANRIDQELALPPFGIRFLIQRKASK